MKSSPGFFHVMWRYLKFCYGRVAIFFLVSVVLCSAVYYLGIANDFETIKKLVGILYDSFINLVIFLPSVAFVLFGLLPSVGRNIKIRLVQKGENHSRRVEGVLDDLALIFYLSVLSVVLSILVKVAWETLSEDKISLLSGAQYDFLIIFSFSFGLAMMMAIIERIWMTIYLMHSILLGEFDGVEREFSEVSKLLEGGEVSRELMMEVAESKIKENLGARSIRALREEDEVDGNN